MSERQANTRPSSSTYAAWFDCTVDPHLWRTFRAESPEQAAFKWVEWAEQALEGFFDYPLQVFVKPAYFTHERRLEYGDTRGLLAVRTATGFEIHGATKQDVDLLRFESTYSI